MPNLVLCSACHRHFRARDAVCPFCGASAASAVAPRAVTGLVPGASRSRRYAASAAFLASSAVFACGETSNGGDANTSAGTGGDQSQVTTGGASSGQGGSKSSQGGSKSNQGGTAAGSGGASAGAAGDVTGGAVSSGGTMQSTGGATGSGGAAAGGTATKATGRACEGFIDRSGCHSVDECSSQPTGIGSVSCVLVEPPRPCGNPQFQPQCPEEGCGDGQVCIQQTCGSLCMAACTETSCAAGNECVEGQCRPLPCSETQVPCPEGFECDFEATGPGNHCAPVQCESGDYQCQPWQDCAQRPGVDAHGCAAHECVADADCGACGYCVNRQCAPQLGVCYQLVAMPYGCVWPDEELM